MCRGHRGLEAARTSELLTRQGLTGGPGDLSDDRGAAARKGELHGVLEQRCAYTSPAGALGHHHLGEDGRGVLSPRKGQQTCPDQLTTVLHAIKSELCFRIAVEQLCPGVASAGHERTRIGTSDQDGGRAGGVPILERVVVSDVHLVDLHGGKPNRVATAVATAMMGR